MKTSAIALGLFAIGTLGGALLHGGVGQHGTPQAAPQKTSTRTDGQGPRTLRSDWGVDDFLARIHEAGDRSLATDADFSPEAKELSGWSNDDFTRVLNQAVAGPDAAYEKAPAGAATRALLRAWMLKDRAACLAWLEGMKSAPMRVALVANGRIWPPGSEEEAMNYSIAHPETYPSYIANRGMWAQGIAAAAVRGGPAAVNDQLAAMRAAGQMPQVTSTIDFPPGFDFSALAKTPEGAKLWQLGHNEVVLGWLKQDRDAAFQALQDYAAGSKWWTLDRGLVTMNSDGPIADPELAGWIAGKLGDLEDDKLRKKIITGEMTVLRSDPAALESFAAGLDPDSRRTVDEYAVTAIHQIGPDAALDHLEHLGTPAERISYLESMDMILPGDSDQVARADLFAQDQVPAFQSRLQSWGATPQQIEAITRRLGMQP